jgi:hypothetical protein
MLTPAERLSYDLATRGTSTGTGFFYAFNRIADQFVPTIVTTST